MINKTVRLTTSQASNYDQLRTALLLEAAGKPLMHVRQYDGFLNDAMVGTDDPDGDGLYSLDVNELRCSLCVRVQFPANMRPADAVRLLRKLLAEIESESDAQQEKPAVPTAAPDLATATLKAALAMVAKGETF